MAKPTFIGLGVEKAATSWIFACLYEHPEICIPQKEINFFSTENLWEKGIKYYSSFFKKECISDTKKGEFSTNYFYHRLAAQRIKSTCPETVLLVCLRNPIDRAFSNYLNDIKAETITKKMKFEEALLKRKEYLEQGKYQEQLERYFSYFDPKQIKVLLYDDIAVNPLKFIQSIYRFIGVNPDFVPQNLNEKINTGRIPGNTKIETLSNGVAAFLQKNSIGRKLWWMVKKSNLPNRIRQLNTQEEKPKINPLTYNELLPYFETDVKYIEQLLHRKLDWLVEKKL